MYTVIRAGESKPWPIKICHEWGDPAAGSWTLIQNSCSPPPIASLIAGSFLRSGGGCEPQINMTVTARDDVCARQDAVFTVSATACARTHNDSGNICILPTGEHSVCKGREMSSLGDQFALFDGFLEPLTADFSGRVVRERRLSIVDECYNPDIEGSVPYAANKYFLQDGKEWMIASGNMYQHPDRIGGGSLFPHPRRPTTCTVVATQAMEILCDDGSWRRYWVNTIRIDIPAEPSQATVRRNNASSDDAPANISP
ncbi:MAG: hypothetical protein M5U15_14425 [Kiritimatiellae bacterium]|nr:hypothetical protein [Kiritimatiellia bacterium]